MSDLIDRQAAIDFIDAGHLCNPNEPRWSDNEVVNFLKSRPSAQPEPCEDAVSRQAVYNVLDKMPVRGFKKDGETIHGLISLSQVNSAIINLPSVQPDLPDWAQKVEEYRKSAPSYINNPIAWALYQTWKEYDR